MSDTWNPQEFKTFLLLYAAQADTQISEAEITMIKKHITDQQFDTIKKAFDETNDYERIQKIMEFRGLYFPTEDRARALIDDVIKLFKADGNFSTLEQNMLKLLKRLI